ncbi:phytoene/squalene synthase family protein [Methanothermobacter marburgensis]|uniref:Phytoene synthase related protein n=1 Tax=Methanothermobacter marburgensis (strain ATCC BAA-927 / DSM 2133 / JCM 14651 / NBRC 100331 / OCM 82 / Marburg) TaxID=79929 RepID=D9PUT2_METTM|nr:phytoene/squalene synthase family protein [Methanothermobacter marburgensis]ADL57979.1 phytoene synthase related protein [Methanothermobacter marburgensis str. Marburg]
MIDEKIYSIFKRGSKTYFYSTLFFPPKVRRDVFILYSFLRKADDYVDRIPQDTGGFYDFVERYRAASSGEKTGDVVVDSFAELSARKAFNKEWTEAFLRSMEMDITVSSYRTMADLEEYLLGSSEVVGLFMASIMGLDTDSYPHARYMGRAMQYVNFIRDIAEDVELGRLYFPLTELERFDLESLDLSEIRGREDNFRSFLRAQIDIYRDWQRRAEEGYSYIPYRYLVPIKTAADMYLWTSRIIERDPLIVYRRKVKPSRGRVVSGALLNMLRLIRPRAPVNEGSI